MNDFSKSIDQALDWIGDLLSEGCQDFLEDVETVSLELEAVVDVLLEPVFGWLDEVDHMISTTSRPFVQTVTPVLQDHPACVGCSHYHGETYGEHLLVCAMHPYGVEEQTCLDWESVWKSGPR